VVLSMILQEVVGLSYSEKADSMPTNLRFDNSVTVFWQELTTLKAKGLERYSISINDFR
jgi:hypothetical protein